MSESSDKCSYTVEKIACHNPCYLTKQGIRLSNELAKRGLEIGQKAADEIESDVIVTGCPFCKEQFEKVIDRGKKLVHYMEVFEQSKTTY